MPWNKKKEKHLLLELEQQKGVENPYALLNWIEHHKKKKR